MKYIFYTVWAMILVFVLIIQLLLFVVENLFFFLWKFSIDDCMSWNGFTVYQDNNPFQTYKRLLLFFE